MNIRRYQDAVLAAAPPALSGDARLAFDTLGLTSEAGEVADVVRGYLHAASDIPLNVSKMVEELGDTLWFVASLAGQLGFSLEELATNNYQKLHHRHPATYPDVVR